MHTQSIDYAAIKDCLKSLQPKNRADTRYAHLAELKEELRDARKRGVSVNTLSAELKAAGTDWQIRLARDRNVIEPGELFFRSGSTVAAAHHLKLIRISAGANMLGEGRCDAALSF
jgi:hypothetical protein